MSTSSFRFGDLLKTAIDPSNTFDLPSMEASGERVSTTIPSQGGNVFVGGLSTITFNLPPVDVFLDTKTSHVAFLAKTEGAGTRFSEGIHCVVKSVRVSCQNGTVIENLESYNLRASALAGLTIADDICKGPLAISQGYFKTDTLAVPGDATSRTNDTVEKYYVLPLTLSAIFGNAKSIPLKFTGGLRLEISLESPAICLVKQADSVANTPMGYTIRNPEFILQGTRYNDVQQSVFDSYFRKNGLSLYGTTFHHTYLSLSTQTASMSISCRDSSIKDIMIVARRNNMLTSTGDLVQKLYKYCTYYVESLQTSFAGNYFPRQAIEHDQNKSAFFQHVSDALHSSITGWRVTPSLWSPVNVNNDNDSSMVIALEYETAGRSNMVSGLSVPSQKQVDIQVNIKLRPLDGGAVPAQRLDVFTHVDYCVRFMPTGDVQVIR